MWWGSQRHGAAVFEAKVVEGGAWQTTDALTPIADAADRVRDVHMVMASVKLFGVSAGSGTR